MAHSRPAHVRALEGNERVYFHPHYPVIAIWYGENTVTFYNSETWGEIMTVSGFGMGDAEQVEQRVDARLSRQGFDREGRSMKRTKVVENEQSE